MSNISRRKDVSSGSGTVIPFPSSRLGSEHADSSGPFLSGLPRLDELKEELKAFIESRVTEAYFRTLLNVRSEADNPFDAIYISRLTPDHVADATLRRLSTFRAIRDLSDEIDFEDEWTS